MSAVDHLTINIPRQLQEFGHNQVAVYTFLKSEFCRL